MESNITEQQYFDGDLQLPEPHFDEEATVAAARPVVPLKEVKERRVGALSGRRLVFGLSIVVSLMVGALGATLLYKQQGQEPATAIVDTAVTGSGASAQSSAVPAASVGETREGVVEAKVPDIAPLADDKKLAPVLARKAESAKAETSQKKSTAREKSISRDEKEVRRGRIEARRLRRKAEREAQREARRKGKPSDDLLRIREIFEGSRKP